MRRALSIQILFSQEIVTQPLEIDMVFIDWLPFGNGFPSFEVTDDEGFNINPDSISSNIGLIVVHYYSESKLEFDAAKLAIHNQFIHFRQSYVLIHDVRFGLEGYSCLYRNSTDFS